MLVGAILGTVIGFACWVIGIKSLMGWNRVQLSDVSRKDEEWFKGEYDVIAMNKFLGKMVWIPTAIFLSAFTVMSFLEWPYGASIPFWVVFVIAIFSLGGLLTYGIIQARGDRFKR